MKHATPGLWFKRTRMIRKVTRGSLIFWETAIPREVFSFIRHLFSLVKVRNFSWISRWFVQMWRKLQEFTIFPDNAIARNREDKRNSLTDDYSFPYWIVVPAALLAIEILSLPVLIMIFRRKRLLSLPWKCGLSSMCCRAPKARSSRTHTKCYLSKEQARVNRSTNTRWHAKL